MAKVFLQKRSTIRPAGWYYQIAAQAPIGPYESKYGASIAAEDRTAVLEYCSPAERTAPVMFGLLDAAAAYDRGHDNIGDELMASAVAYSITRSIGISWDMMMRAQLRRQAKMDHLCDVLAGWQAYANRRLVVTDAMVTAGAEVIREYVDDLADGFITPTQVAEEVYLAMRNPRFGVIRGGDER